MHDGKSIFREILYFLSITILLGFTLTVIFFPYASIIANRYLTYNFYQTILFEFFKFFIPFIQISAPLTFAGYFSHRSYIAISVSKLNPKKNTVLVLIFSSAFIAVGSVTISYLTFQSRNVPIDISLFLFVSSSLIIISIIFFIFKKRSGSVNKFLFYLSSAIFLTTVLLFTIFNSNRNSSGQNIIFIVVDTLRADHTSLGKPEKKTTECLKNTLLPDSVYFKSGYSNSPWTLPSVSSMITSRYPSQLGIKNLVCKLDESEFTIAELMREEGYRTGAIISHILLKKDYGISQGFDYFNDKNISGKYGNHIAISSPGITKDAIKFIRAKKGNKFFLFLHYFDPHYIYLNHEEKNDYKGAFRSKDISFLRDKIRKNEFSTVDTDYLKYCYDTEIRFTDFHIGRVIEELKKLRIYNNTIIVFTSDHGEEFVERGWLGHSTTLYKEQTGVPILIKAKKEIYNQLKRFEGIPVSNIDIIPTLISMAGTRRIPGIMGKNLLTTNSDNHFFFQEVSQKEFGTDIELVSVVWKKWKMIKDLLSNKYKLYNLGNDPEEKTDLTGLYPNIDSKLKLMIQKWMKNTGNLRQNGKKRKSLSEKEKEKLKTLGYIN